MDYDYAVPKGLLITDPDQSRRLFLEQEKLQKYFPQFGFVRDRAGRLHIGGSLRTNQGNHYRLRIEISDQYPHRIPFIHPDGWDSSCPHVYDAGNLCIMRPDQWRPFYSIAFVVAKSAIWLTKFEVYGERGYWPGNEQEHR